MTDNSPASLYAMQTRVERLLSQVNTIITETIHNALKEQESTERKENGYESPKLRHLPTLRNEPERSTPSVQ